MDGKEIGAGEVRGAHGDGLVRAVDFGGFVNVTDFGAADEFEQPAGDGLTAGYEAFRDELRWVSLGPHTGWALAGGELTMPVAGSTLLERVSTATTWLQRSFQAQYFRQFAQETSRQE